MRYENEELMRQLGAEYVIGTLRGAARRRFERLMHSNAEARAQVDFWEQRLSEFGQVLRPVDPPAAARAEVLSHTEPALQIAAGSPRKASGQRRRRARWAWPYVAGFATAASLVVAFLVGQRNALAPPPVDSLVPVVVARELQAAAGMPMYVAQVSIPASSMRWMLSVSKDHRTLEVTASDDFVQAGRSRVQLWCVLPGVEPLALGEVPLLRHETASFDIPAAVEGADEVSFAITLEPEDVPRGGSPTRPVLSSAAALDSI